MMCTAISYLGNEHYFGRNLDLDYHYAEQVVVVPRHFLLASKDDHPGIIGIATMAKDYPLFYDATNEHGLSVAALNFPGNGVYHKDPPDKVAIPSYDFISFLLTRCKSAKEAWELLQKAVVTDDSFSPELPPTPLHWLIADRQMAFVAESMADGLHLWENPVGVLTNNPPFDWMLDHLSLYMGLTAEEAKNRFEPDLPLTAFSRGMGAYGLPGDFSSPSRFVRAAFVLHNSPKGDIDQFFHILGAAEQVDGCVVVGNQCQKTLYSSCCNTDRGIYYYCTYQNRQLTAVDMHKENLDGDSLSCFPLVTEQQIRWES